MKLKHIIVICLFVTTIFARAQTPGENTTQNRNVPIGKVMDSDFSFITIPSINNTWGYDIFNGEKRIIHQKNIPGMPGNNGFKSRNGAKKVAELVIIKLKNGEMPPSVTKEELVNLKVL